MKYYVQAFAAFSVSHPAVDFFLAAACVNLWQQQQQPCSAHFTTWRRI